MPKITHLRHVDQPRPGEYSAAGNTARVGDLVTWTNPKTREEWPELLVEFVHSMQGRLMVRGHFGRFTRDGDEHVQSKPVLMTECVVTARAGEGV